MSEARTDTRARGTATESQAADYLAARGLRIVARNYRTRAGEIDLIADHAGTLVFVEVRARSGRTHGTPFETVDLRKQGRIVRAAAQYVQTIAPHAPPPCRFDVVGISGPDAGSIEWLQAAFTAA